ncbi:hypothetical protein EDB81DRAFT_794371 [Dactylonectria macrodidyma]|uniref:Secreted protein n=1 Tax=Dactylonectria macrodidyma TaxID=307937 RepID=A0A9P9EUW3_9HYPO|nr:hypothetical protein EDB81DRAFT_794371 [Dactylonectria macrodidyma]
MLACVMLVCDAVCCCVLPMSSFAPSPLCPLAVFTSALLPPQSQSYHLHLLLALHFPSHLLALLNLTSTRSPNITRYRHLNA